MNNGHSLDDDFDYDSINDMIKGTWESVDRRSLTQIVASKSLLQGKDINNVVKARDDKTLSNILTDYLYLTYSFSVNDEVLFVNDDKRRYISYSESTVAKLICNEFGISDKTYITSLMPEISNRIIAFCERDKREFTDRTIRNNWFIVNFTNVSYNVNSGTAYPHNNFEIKTAYINANYLSKEERNENSGGLQKFAECCSDDLSEQKRILQAIAYVISDYRDKNRLFVFESNSEKPLRIIDLLLKKILGNEQIRYVPLHSLTDNMNLKNVKIIISKNCNASYAVDDNYELYNILNGTDIPYFYEVKKDTIHTQIRNDLVVFHFRKLPTKFMESLNAENHKLISVVKIQDNGLVNWDEMETQILNDSDYGVSYLIDEVLPELSENEFNLTESELSKQSNPSTENPITQVKLFINDKCETVKGYTVRKEDLHNAFKEFSGINNRNGFYDIIRELGYEEGKKDNKHVFKDIALK